MSSTNGQNQLSAHPAATIFPPMVEEDFQALKADIAAYGLREPLWLFEGKILDGRNRYLACQELGIEPITQEWNGNGSAVAFVVSLNLTRRHLNSGQRAVCAAEAKRMLAREAKQRMREGGGDKKSRSAKERGKSGKNNLRNASRVAAGRRCG
jgi:hypothetical protein